MAGLDPHQLEELPQEAQSHGQALMVERAAHGLLVEGLEARVRELEVQIEEQQQLMLETLPKAFPCQGATGATRAEDKSEESDGYENKVVRVRRIAEQAVRAAMSRDHALRKLHSKLLAAQGHACKEEPLQAHPSCSQEPRQALPSQASSRSKPDNPTLADHQPIQVIVQEPRHHSRAAVQQHAAAARGGENMRAKEQWVEATGPVPSPSVGTHSSAAPVVASSGRLSLHPTAAPVVASHSAEQAAHQRDAEDKVFII